MEAFIGTILPWAGNYVPQGWLVCDGAVYALQQKTQFQALYAVIGNTYGGNPSQMTFAVPDLRGRLPLGAGQATGGAFIQQGTAGVVQAGEGSAQLPYLAVNYIICYNGIFPMRDD
jgi:microcystin-dependent protein